MPTIDFIEEEKVMAVEYAAKAQSRLDTSLAVGLAHYHACATGILVFDPPGQ